MKDLHIRPAGAGDEPAIVALIRELAESDHESSPITPEYVTGYLARPNNIVLLAQVNGQIIGLLSYFVHPSLYHAGDSCLIDELVVQQSWRSQGAGRALIRACLEQAQALNCAEVSVTTMPDNRKAQAFYRAHGFTDEAVFLEKHL